MVHFISYYTSVWYNKKSTISARNVENWIGVENVVYFSQRFKGRSAGGTKEGGGARWMSWSDSMV